MSDDFQFCGIAALKSADWLAAPATQDVLKAIEAAGFDARAVGGCVRNTLMGQGVADIDIATTALPDEVMEIARQAGFSCHPTGIDHGTVTVVSRGAPFEVTTLRRDVETMGRRAVVAFTTDWAEDAMRRDFTMNALYCDRRGDLFDPLSGVGDLAARRVVFIGDARERIREDFLRILRFFRFFAIYAEGPADEAGLAACVAERDGIALLSAERLREEILKILVAPRALEAVALMDETGILARSLGQAPDGDGTDFDGRAAIAALRRLACIEQSVGREPDGLLRLGVAFLAGRRGGGHARFGEDGGAGDAHRPTEAEAKPETGDAGELARLLRLSNRDRDRLIALDLAAEAFAAGTEQKALRRVAYRYGTQAACDGLLARHALYSRVSGAGRASEIEDTEEAEEAKEAVEQLSHGLSEIAAWRIPALPFKGSDLIAIGVTAGPEMGAILKRFEDWWVEADFPDDTDLLASRLRALAGVP